LAEASWIALHRSADTVPRSITAAGRRLDGARPIWAALSPDPAWLIGTGSCRNGSCIDDPVKPVVERPVRSFVALGYNYI